MLFFQVLQKKLDCFLKKYIELIKKVLKYGEKRIDRTGIGVLSVFGTQTHYDLREGFPLLTTKKVFFDSRVQELLWFLKGSTNIHELKGTKIWDNWADENGDLGPIYGYQWRSWEKFVWDKHTRQYRKETVDQISQAIDMLKKNPYSRRIIVNAWNVADIDKMALPPCHTMFHFSVRKGQRLDCHLYQRSADLALGVPFNIASYALLLQMFAMECTFTPGILVHTLGDAHIYLNHIEKLQEQIKNEILSPPSVIIKKKSFFDITFEDITLHNYKSAGRINFDIAV